MRINKFVALASGISRRAADAAIANGRVAVNGQTPSVGQTINGNDAVTFDGKPLHTPLPQTIILNKPVGYVCSRNGQGSRTIYDLLPPELHALKPVGRLDKNSSGLLVMTNDGEMANQLTHPRYVKKKIYHITLDQPLQPLHRQMIQEKGIMLEDGISQFIVEREREGDDTRWKIIMSEGRNRQIRRTFAALGYTVTTLDRVQFGNYKLGHLKIGSFESVKVS